MKKILILNLIVEGIAKNNTVLGGYRHHFFV